MKHEEQLSLGMGRYGMQMIPPTTSVTAKFAALHFIAAGELDVLTSSQPLIGTFTGLSYAAGTVLYGPVTGLTTDATARVIGYFDTRR